MLECRFDTRCDIRTIPVYITVVPDRISAFVRTVGRRTSTRPPTYLIQARHLSPSAMAGTLPPNPKLPPELLSMVKEFIPIEDLRTHVCFYNTCHTVASFYGKTPEEEEAFWKKSCTLCGLCLVNDESWKAVAFECISQDGFCSHPACGGALLDWNGE